MTPIPTPPPASALIRSGTDEARRGWLSKENVRNTRPRTALRQALAKP